MLSSTMMSVLIVFYLIVAFVSAYEGNWLRVLYWASASGITTAVFLSTK